MMSSETFLHFRTAFCSWKKLEADKFKEQEQAQQAQQQQQSNS